MKRAIFYVLLALSALKVNGMCFDTIGYLSFSDTVYLRIENGEKIYLHTIRQGQTLFSLARFYGLHYQELQYFNSGLGERVSVGQQVRIPIPNRAIIRYLPAKVSRRLFAPVVYVVKKGDTLFRIGQYFKLSANEVGTRGGVGGNTLKPGTLIPIGWISTRGIPEEDRPEPAHPMLKRNLPLRQKFESVAKGRTLQKLQGPAYWQQGGPEEGSAFFARFNDAAKHAVIEIVNPMNQGKIFAEVLGPIPPTIYDPRVIVVLSPAAAKMLGARDPQFFVKIRYYK
jgi:LysM repeat protein